MLTYIAGDFIKRERERRGISQDDLAEPQMNRSTLSKIERGKAVPTKQNLDTLLEKLGYNPHTLPYLLLDFKTARFQETTDRLDTFLAIGQTVEADALIKELERDKRFLESDVNQQYLYCVKAASLLIKDRKSLEIEGLLNKAIGIGIPGFSEKYLEKYFLSAYDLRALTMLAMFQADSGKLDESISILYALVENLENNCIDKSGLGRHYPYLAYNLTRRLYFAKKYQEAADLCERGREICRNTGWFEFSPLLAFNQIYCWYELNEIKKCKEFIYEVYYTLGHFGRDSQKIALNKFAQEKFGIELERRLITKSED